MDDILIRGLKMPQQGLKVVAIHSNGHVYADTSDPGFLNKIADVIELPKHGDLIDRDAHYALMEKYTDYGGATEPHDENQIHRDSVLFAIETAPVVVPSNKEETE